ncbi:MAG: hypothetical protein ACK4JY_06910 [Brevundimonas sp.]|uniref:hypothetical protein n=1 Tax=Brevundimonas sp. TaxID=1871086 RepID=UPI00391C1CB9
MIALLALWAAFQAAPAPIDVHTCDTDVVEVLGYASDFDPLEWRGPGHAVSHGSAALSHDEDRFGAIDLFIPEFGTIRSAAGYTSWRLRRHSRLERVYCARGGDRPVAFRGEPVPDLYARQPSSPPEIPGARNYFNRRFRGGPEGQWFVGLWRAADQSTIVALFLDGSDRPPEVLATTDRALAAVALMAPLHGGPVAVQTISAPSGGEPAYLSAYSWVRPQP